VYSYENENKIQCTYNITLWRVRASILAMERE